MNDLPRYDVYRTSDRRMVLRDVSMQDAAKKAGVSVNFVVLSAARHARNRYGRVATLTGYFFYPQGEIPDFELNKRDRYRQEKEQEKAREKAQYDRIRRYLLDGEAVDAALKERGFAHRQEFCRRTGISPSTLSNLINRGLDKYQPHNRCVEDVCTYLNLEPQRVLRRKFIKVPV